MSIIEFAWDNFTGFFRRKRLLVVNMIDPQGDVTIFRRKIKENKFEYKNGYYTIKKDRVYYNKSTQRAMAYYFEGNPEPVEFTHTKNPFMSSESLYEAIKSDMTKDVYMRDDDKMFMLLIILAAVNILIGIVSLLYNMKVIK